jgi:hypothetical protein
MKRYAYLSCLFLLLLMLGLAACGAEGMAVAPELIDADAITARAFGNDECFLTLAAAVPARLNPDAETATNGEIPAGEVEAIQALTLRDDGGLWYQIAPEGVWIRVDDTDYTTRGDCRP